jgi:hypothetical protein
MKCFVKSKKNNGGVDDDTWFVKTIYKFKSQIDGECWSIIKCTETFKSTSKCCDWLLGSGVVLILYKCNNK